MRKCRVFLLLSILGIFFAGVLSLSADAAWTKSGDYTYYYDEHGVMLTGFHMIGNKKYYFNPQGQLQTGRFVATDGKTYYGATPDGAIVSNQWVGKYYFQADGSMAVNTWVDGKQIGADGRYTGVKRNIGWVTKNKKKYYYNPQGELVKGMAQIDGKLYYFNPSNGVLKTGLFKVGKKYYYAQKTGVLITNKWKGGRYYQNDGSAATGWAEIGGKSYLLNSSGKKRSGWVKYKKVYYYCVKGVVQKDSWVSKKKYYVLASGARAAGWQTIGKYTYYFDPSSGIRKTGYVKIAGVRYCLGSKGRLQKNGWVGSKKYYASASGALLTGLQNVDGSLYYFKPSNGKKLTKKKKTINSNTYYFTKTGAAAKDTWVKLSSKYYYFQSDCTMAKNKWIDNYYVGLDGARTKQTKKTGWVTVDGKKYYYNKKGVMVTGWKTISGSKYYFDKSTGVMLTGLQTVSDKKHYFYSDGRLATSITIAVGLKEYTINTAGDITAEKSIKVSGNSTGAKIVNFALQYVGNPYVWGGTSLTNGADCSGFVQTVFAHFGIKLLRVADDQMKGPSSAISKEYKQPVIVDISSMQPGDLIFYGASTYATHVAIYMGDGKIVHASNSQPYPQGGIKISDYNYSTPVRVVRYWS